MIQKNSWKIFCAICVLALWPDAKAYAQGPVVVELFTSQSCSSCPPADAYLKSLSRRDDMIALSYHVDYWNNTFTFSGKWADPFSDPKWSQLQGQYAKRMGRGNSVYTPQMVIDGRFETSGGKRAKVDELIAKARNLRHSRIQIEQGEGPNGALAITLTGDPNGNAYDVSVARYLRAASTDVRAGENKGEKIDNVNIVRDIMGLGKWYGSKMTYHYPVNTLSNGEGCAILVRERGTQRVEAAQTCGF